MTATATTGRILIAIGDNPPTEVAAFSIDYATERTRPTEITLRSGDVNASIAFALREAADRLDPVVALIRCPECPATLAYDGTATLEHADGGAHVFSPTLGDRA